MKSISDLLLHYHIPGVQFAEIRRICAEEITNMTGIPLTSKQMQFKNEELILSVPPVLKSALILKQNELVSRLQARGVEVKSFK